MAFKMKGSPMYRNFGIGKSPVEQEGSATPEQVKRMEAMLKASQQPKVAKTRTQPTKKSFLAPKKDVIKKIHKEGLIEKPKSTRSKVEIKVKDPKAKPPKAEKILKIPTLGPQPLEVPAAPKHTMSGPSGVETGKEGEIVRAHNEDVGKPSHARKSHTRRNQPKKSAGVKQKGEVKGTSIFGKPAKEVLTDLAKSVIAPAYGGGKLAKKAISKIPYTLEIKKKPKKNKK